MNISDRIILFRAPRGITFADPLKVSGTKLSQGFLHDRARRIWNFSRCTLLHLSVLKSAHNADQLI